MDNCRMQIYRIFIILNLFWRTRGTSN